MNEEELKKWKGSGILTRKVLHYAKTLVKPETPLIEIAEKVDDKIKSLGVGTAFPINLSINEVAAHYTPVQGDGKIAQGLIKVDLGISVDGYISDSALSIDLSPEQKYKEIIKVNELALQNAISIIKESLEVREIGKIIHKTITDFGFSPIVNLTGHELSPWNLHTGTNIPNYDNGNKSLLHEGMIFAIEPFVTQGQGMVQDGPQSNIYRLEQKKNVRDPLAREIVAFVDNTYKTLPFASRWLIEKFGSRAAFSLKILEQEHVLHHYPQLIEKSKMPVSQAEHTVYVSKDKALVLTEQDD